MDSRRFVERYAELLSEAERISLVELWLGLGEVVTWEGVLEERSKESCADS